MHLKNQLNDTWKEIVQWERNPFWLTSEPAGTKFIDELTCLFSYALFMSWINETSEASKNHYGVSHRRESIKTKQENELLKIISGYILFTTSFYSL